MCGASLSSVHASPASQLCVLVVVGVFPVVVGVLVLVVAGCPVIKWAVVVSAQLRWSSSVADCPALSSMSSSIRLVCGQAAVSGTKGWMSGYSGRGVLAG